VLSRQQRNARRCRVQPKLERVEGLVGDDKLAIKDEAFDWEFSGGADYLREIPAEWTLPPRLQTYRCSVPEE